MNLIEQAQSFATQKHVLDNHQLYGSVLPYTHHLADVARVLVRFTGVFDHELQAAAWLHDVVEDTRGRPNEVRIRDIEELFGEEVASLVAAVTSDDGPNRRVRNALTYPRIRAAGERAVCLKLADRIANVEHGGRALDMYVKEHVDFRHALLVPKQSETTSRMWAHLDDLLGYEVA